MTPILYYNPLSPFAHKCRIALMERAVAFDLKIPKSFGTGTPDPEFLALNPLGEVPVLIDDNTIVSNSPFILRYIQDRWMPSDQAEPTPSKRARSAMIEQMCDTKLDPVHWSLGEAKWFGRVPVEAMAGFMARSNEQIRATHEWLSGQLGDAQWFDGDRFGDTDICVVVHVAGGVNHGYLPAPDTNFGAWFARASQRPSVAAVLKSAQDWFAALQPAEIGKWLSVPRQYRDHRLEWMVKSVGFETIAQAHIAGKIFFAP
jgi:glutathione S-transferase